MMKTRSRLLKEAYPLLLFISLLAAWLLSVEHPRHSQIHNNQKTIAQAKAL